MLRVGLTGLAQFVLVVAVGGGLAALVTPAISRRIGFASWMVALLAMSGAVRGRRCACPTDCRLQLLAGLVLGFAAQALKICVDTTVQRTVSDEFRGRVFALYDTLFNLALVAAAVITAVAAARQRPLAGLGRGARHLRTWRPRSATCGSPAVASVVTAAAPTSA